MDEIWGVRIGVECNARRVDATDQTCCGRYSWDRAGPLLRSCTLCPESPSYWRRADNRADGRPYQSLTAEQVYERIKLVEPTKSPRRTHGTS